jgi:hypothetical protein
MLSGEELETEAQNPFSSYPKDLIAHYLKQVMLKK